MQQSKPRTHSLLTTILLLACTGIAGAHWHQPMSWTERTHPPRRPPPRFFVEERAAEAPRIPFVVRDFEVRYPAARSGKDRKHEDHERPAPGKPLEEQGS